MHKASMLLLKKELQNNKSALLDTSIVPFRTRFQENTDIIRLRFHSSFSQSRCWLSQSHSLPPTGFSTDLTGARWQHYINRKPTLLQKKKCFLPVWSLCESPQALMGAREAGSHNSSSQMAYTVREWQLSSDKSNKYTEVQQA